MTMVTLNTYHVIVKQNSDSTYSWEIHYDLSGNPYKKSTETFSKIAEAFQAGTHWLNLKYELGTLPHYEAEQ